MPSNKLARTNDDIQLVMSKLLREIKDPRVNQGMISVTWLFVIEPNAVLCVFDA